MEPSFIQPKRQAFDKNPDGKDLTRIQRDKILPVVKNQPIALKI